jgi:hypothetical protein
LEPCGNGKFGDIDARTASIIGSALAATLAAKSHEKLDTNPCISFDIK